MSTPRHTLFNLDTADQGAVALYKELKRNKLISTAERKGRAMIARHRVNVTTLKKMIRKEVE